MEHTKEPWGIDARAATRIVGQNDRGVATSGGPYTTTVEDGGLSENEANAARIVACVNACAGIPDPARFVAAVERAREALRSAQDSIARERFASALKSIGEALRALTPEQAQ